MMHAHTHTHRPGDTCRPTTRNVDVTWAVFTVKERRRLSKRAERNSVNQPATGSTVDWIVGLPSTVYVAFVALQSFAKP
eukprot:1527151-Prymnesium_polylepis.1